MGLNIGPILPRNPVSGVKRASRSDATTEKVKRIKLPTGYSKTSLQGRDVALLKETTSLARYIKTNWDELGPEELADNIIALEDKVSVLKETSPAVKKVRQLAEHLHFNFVF